MKAIIGLINSQFHGTEQQDSQEFLSVLIDGLHEDLNRVGGAMSTTVAARINRSQSVANLGREDSVVASEAWKAFQARNRSVIVDTMYGQLKSHVTCPECGFTSVSFEAYNLLCLPLPADDEICIYVKFIGRNRATPTKYGLRLPRSGTVHDMKQSLCEFKRGLTTGTIVITELFGGRIFRAFAGKTAIRDVEGSDTITAYEVLANQDDSSVLLVEMLSRICYPKKEFDGYGLTSCKDIEVFGTPLLLSISADITCAQLYEHIWDQMSHLLKSEGFTAHKAPYHIYVTNNAGTDDGTMLPCTTKPAVSFLYAASRSVALTLEWPQDVHSSVYDREKAQKLVVHSTVKSVHSPPKNAQPGRTLHLSDCFNSFVEREQLGSDDAWHCEKCKEKRRAFKKIEIWSVPEVLVIQLKRFQERGSSGSSRLRTKNDRLVDFPLEGLDLSMYVRGPGKHFGSLYDLFAVSEHIGGMGGGHYTAMAQNFSSGKWYMFNDSSVNEIDAWKCKSSRAYILFYRRRPE
jgi:ubiquitin carboxyl-terminal hydrolase 4/11/15